MPWKETLYRRPLRKPIDDSTREAIRSEYSRRRHEIPIPTELSWHAERPEFTIRSKYLAFIVKLANEEMIVDAELTLAAKMFATDDHRRQAVKFIESIAEDLKL